VSENESRVEILAQRIETAGLTPVAIVLLEITRALGLLASQTLIIGEPLLSGLVNPDALRETSDWLADPDRVEELILRLEMGTPTGREAQ
jgi:hypothetical protein